MWLDNLTPEGELLTEQNRLRDSATKELPEPGFWQGSLLDETGKGLVLGGISSSNLVHALGAAQLEQDLTVSSLYFPEMDAEPQIQAQRDEQERLGRDTAEAAKLLRPDPQTVGLAGQLLSGAAEILPRTIAATVAAGPAGLVVGALAAGAPAGYTAKHVAMSEGVDEATATGQGLIEGITMTAGAALPGAHLVKPVLGDLAAVGVANVGLGVAQRAATAELLERNGYTAQAAQYRAFDGTAMTIDAVMGAAFGIVGRAGDVKGTLARRPKPAEVDAALAGNNAQHAIDTAPGIPTDPRAANAHLQQLDVASGQLLRGEDVRLPDDVPELAYLVRGEVPDPLADAVARARYELDLDNDRPLLQNRDRSTPASVQQMVDIAANPDYGRLGFSRDFANGAPVVEPGAVIPAEQMGRADYAVTSTGRRIPVQYAVVEADQLLASNRADGTTVPEYEGGTAGASRVIAGNGRVAGISLAHQRGRGADYAQAMADDASMHGVPADVVQRLRSPVLVRVMPQEHVTANIGDESNVSGTAALSGSEQAWNDARRVDLEHLQFAEDGAITSATVRQFVQAMPGAERSGLLDGGQPSRQAVARLESAVFATAYESDALVRLQAQATDPEVRTVLSGLLMAAPKMARLRGTGEYDVRGVVVEAAEAAVNARRSGQRLDEFARQGDIARNPEAQPILDLFADNIRSAKRIGEALSELADRFHAEAGKADADMFGSVPKRSRGELLDAGLAAKLDAPNFGQGEWPQAIPDDDPFWSGIPGRETANIDTPERQALREQLVDEHFAGVEPPRLAPGDRPIAYVMGGGGGSGKGHVLGRLQAEGDIPESGLVHIDPDAIKAGEHGISGIPEYREMFDRRDSRAAAVVHEESSQIASRVRERAMAGRYDMLLDRTLGDPAKTLAELQALKDAGYEVRLFGVTVDPAVAVERAGKRAVESRRYVPNDRLLAAHKGFAEGFEDYARLADSAWLYDNTGDVREIASGKGGQLAVLDQAAYDEFKSRRLTNEQATTYRELLPQGTADSERALTLRPGTDGTTSAEAAHRGVGVGSTERLAGGRREVGKGESRGSDGVTDPEVQLAQTILDDIGDVRVPTGATDADGNPVTVSARELLAEADTDIQRAQLEAKGIEAAATCALQRGE